MTEPSTAPSLTNAPHIHYPVEDTAGWYCAICGQRYRIVTTNGTDGGTASYADD